MKEFVENTVANAVAYGLMIACGSLFAWPFWSVIIEFLK